METDGIYSMPLVQRAHKIRLTPTKAQRIQLAKTVGTARYAYNWGVARCEELYKAGEKHLSGYDLRATWVKDHPKWAEEVAASCIYSSFLHVDAAYKRFFRERNGHPKFHKKGVHDSFNVAGDKGRVIGKRVRIPGVGYVKMTEELRFSGARIMSYSVSKRADKWFVSIQCEVEDTRIDNAAVVGIDVGCKNWATTSDGEVLPQPTTLVTLRRKLKRAMRDLSRKKKGSNNRSKARLKVAKLYLKIDNIKTDATHKFTTKVAKNHGTVIVESLDMASMKSSDNKYVRKGTQNAVMGEILRQLKYKTVRTISIGKYYPSSKMCSNCGTIKQDLSLSDRTYHCDSCHCAIDRDLNAARNILVEGLRKLKNHPGSLG